MNEWVDLVIVKFAENEKVYLFHAPAWSHLKKGDIVLCETKRGIQQATVVTSDSVKVDDKKVFDMWSDICNATTPLKKIKGVFKEYEYPEENAEPEGGEADGI